MVQTCQIFTILTGLECIAFDLIQAFTCRGEAAFAKHKMFTPIGEFN